MAQYIINFAYISGSVITLSADNLSSNGDNVEKSAEPVDNPVNEVGMVEINSLLRFQKVSLIMRYIRYTGRIQAT
jgi:hypothetical protein